MKEQPLTLGEYVRRLRRGQRWSLHRLSEETELSYSHLSRVENDSTVPGAETVARIATALDGDLRRMLEMADCLPRVILDRIVGREGEGAAASLKRTAGRASGERPRDGGLGALVAELAISEGLSVEESSVIADAVERLVRLDTTQRTAVTGLIKSISVEDHGAAP